MSFRARLTLAAALAVAVAVAVGSAVAYLAARSELHGQVDEGLEDRAEILQRFPISVFRSRPGQVFVRMPPGVLGGAEGYIQLVTAEGGTQRAAGDEVALPVDDRTREVAAGSEERFYRDAEVEGVHVRILTVPLVPGLAAQVTRPLTEVDDSLARLRTTLLLVSLGGIGLAAALGLAVARTALAPVRNLTEATEHVTDTRDLTSRIDVRGDDELSRLARSFNTMLAALEESARAQRRFVADASHELRTPLTSLRTNIEVLARADALPSEERERLLADVVEQLAEMSALVSELVALDRAEAAAAEREELRLDLVAAEAIERARRNTGGVTFAASLEESTVHGVAGSIERAIGNLLDNAAKWSPPGGEVEVTVAGGAVAVRDHGPGIAEEDLPHVFDRFYRASSARNLPGSGLGLAIVHRVAEAHGAAVSIERPDGGGTLVRLSFPPAEEGSPAGPRELSRTS
jgi:two-component system sensor histidine kinase MprB